MDPAQKADGVNPFGKCLRHKTLQPPVCPFADPKDKIDPVSRTFSHPFEQSQPLIGRIIFENLLHYDSVKDCPLAGRKNLTKVSQYEIGSRTNNLGSDFGSEPAKQIDGDSVCAPTCQRPRHLAITTTGVQEELVFCRCHPRKKKSSYPVSAEDKVPFPVALRTFFFDSIPKLPRRTVINLCQFISGILAHVTQAVQSCTFTIANQKKLSGFCQKEHFRFLDKVELGVSLVLLILFSSSCTSQPPAVLPQPIAFSHASHAEMGITCLACHAGANRGAKAGIPSISLCVTCHRGIIPNHPEVKKVLEHYEKQEPIFWRKVNVMPSTAMVFFKHRPHVRAGIDCSRCHGDVASMALARPVIDLADMGFCLDCHRESGASVDCLVCHH